ncbi:MAG TPA: hypothetical protein VI980_06330 [Acidimicrobiia bacterium]|nr:hypothetical protein [Acidimicrobiia bacterium]
MADSYHGPVRVLGGDGIMLTTGMANLETDPEMGSWRGVLETLSGTGVAGKALVVELEIPGGSKGRAQLTPLGDNGDRASSALVGLGAQPF